MPSHARRPRVLLVTGQAWTSLALLPRVLARARLDLTLLAPPSLPLMRTSLARRKIPVSGDLLDALRDHLATHAYDWIIPADDPTLFALVDRYDEGWIERWFCVPRDAVPIVSSKLGFQAACARAGLPTPQTLACHDLDDLPAVADALRFPIILRPARGCAGAGVVVLQSKADLPRPASLPVPPGGFIAQRFMPGRVGITQIFYWHGRAVCWVSSYKHLLCFSPFSPSAARVLADPPEIPHAVHEFGRMTRFYGLCGLDWIESPDGRIHLIEVNARPTHLARGGAFAGVDFADAIRLAFAGRTPARSHPASHLDSFHATSADLFPQEFFRQLRTYGWPAIFPTLLQLFSREVPWDDPGIASVLLRQVCDAFRYYLPDALHFKAHVRRLLAPAAAAAPQLRPSAPSPLAVTIPSSITQGSS